MEGERTEQPNPQSEATPPAPEAPQEGGSPSLEQEKATLDAEKQKADKGIIEQARELLARLRGETPKAPEDPEMAEVQQELEEAIRDQGEPGADSPAPSPDPGTTNPPEEPSWWQTIMADGVKVYLTAFVLSLSPWKDWNTALHEARQMYSTEEVAPPAGERETPAAEDQEEDPELAEEDDHAHEDEEDEETISKQPATQKKHEPDKKRPATATRPRGPHEVDLTKNAPQGMEVPQDNPNALVEVVGTCESVSSGTGQRGKHGTHKGIDVPGPKGSPIRYCGEKPAKVTFVSPTPHPKAGYYIEFAYRDPIKGPIIIRCLHFAKKSSLKVGTILKKGDILGLMGNTGRVRSKRKGPDAGTHLHMEARSRSAKGPVLNPLTYLRRAS